MRPEFTHLLDSFGWAILHSLWQGGVAFIAVVLIRIVLKNNAPALRYSALMFVLFGCLVAFFITFGIYAASNDPQLLAATAQANGQASFGGLIPAFDGTQDPTGFAWPNVSAYTPFLALLWVIGFMSLSLRYAFAYGQVQQLRVLGVSEAPLNWKLRFLNLLEKSGISKTVKLHVSPHIDGPMTMGFLKPVVLVPAGFLTGIPADQVEAVLLHELAHIRRHDYAFNLVQTGIKTVLFYHPAIHIISRWIDRDREQACDDVAVAKGQNPKALLRGLAALRIQTGSLAMAASGKGEETPLMDRLTRLAGHRQTPRRPEHVLMSLLSALMIGTVYVGAMARADAHPHPKNPRAIVKAPEPPVAPTLPDAVISVKAATPVPPAPPVMPPLDFDGIVDEGAFQSFIETDKAIWKSFSIAMKQYEKSLEKYIEKSDLSDDELEDLVDDYEDFAEDIEDMFEDRRELVEEKFEEYVESRIESSDFERKLEEKIEREVERAVEMAERTIENDVREIQTEKFARSQNLRKKAENNREYLESKARIKAEKARKNTVKVKGAKHDHEAFRDKVMSELLKDGLIKSKSDKVLLSHPQNTMYLNGEPMPKAFKGKYCDMWDKAGYMDGKTEIKITPDALTVLTDFKDGQHKTKVTYGTWKD